MNYFDDLTFLAFDHVPRCSVWIDRKFPKFYALNFAYAGQILWGMDNAPPIKLSAPVAWWTWPGPRFEYGCSPGDYWDHYYVTFVGQRAERFFSQGLAPTCHPSTPYRQVADADKYRATWDSLFALLGPGEIGTNASAAHCLEGLFLNLHQAETSTTNNSSNAAITALGSAIRNELTKQWDWREEARKQHISEAHLRRLFNEHLHAPPHQYLLRSRLQAAARLLRSTAIPITQIAEAVGIPDIYHFSKLFKAHYNMAPRHYRRQMRLFFEPFTDGVKE